LVLCRPFPCDYCDLDLQIPAWGNNTGGPPTPQNAATVSVLRGNDGSVFPSPVTDQSILSTLFTPFLRSIDLYYAGATEYKGVPLLDFTFAPHLFANSFVYEPNHAFFQDGVNGLLNMSYMSGGIPLYVSGARFGGADTDPSLEDAIISEYVAPPETVEPTIYSVEPDSGVLFHVRTSSQVNAYISPMPKMPANSQTGSTVWFRNMTALYMPVMWAQDEGGIGDKDAATISTVLTIISVCKNGGLSIGITFTALAIIFLFLSWRTWDLEHQKHLHAVRSLFATSEEDAAMAKSLAAGSDHSLVGNGIGSSSLLDPSVLVMREDSSIHRNYSSARDVPRSNHLADVDITYRRSMVDPPSALRRSNSAQGIRDDGEDEGETHHYRLQKARSGDYEHGEDVAAASAPASQSPLRSPPVNSAAPRPTPVDPSPMDAHMDLHYQQHTSP
jgi:hypothetical protein